jgi:hypothetical protein
LSLVPLFLLVWSTDHTHTETHTGLFILYSYWNTDTVDSHYYVTAGIRKMYQYNQSEFLLFGNGSRLGYRFGIISSISL